MVVLCDAGPLIALAKLNRLDLLAELYEEVQTPRAVYDEVGFCARGIGCPDCALVLATARVADCGCV